MKRPSTGSNETPLPKTRRTPAQPGRRRATGHTAESRMPQRAPKNDAIAQAGAALATKEAKRPARIDRHREIILAAAAEFGRNGYAETTMAGVAEILSIHTAELYYYFESKETLVEAILKYGVERIIQHMNDVIIDGTGMSAGQKLEAVIRNYIHSGGNKEDISIAFWKIYDQVSPDLRRTVSAQAKPHYKAWRMLVNDAAAEGAIRNDVAPGLFRQLLIGSLTWVPAWYQPNGRNTLDEIADTVIAIYIRGPQEAGEKA